MKIKVNGIEGFRQKKNAQIQADINEDGKLVILREGGHKIVSKIMLTWGEVQRISKLTLKNFKPSFDRSGKLERQNIDLSALADFKPETDKNVQYLFTLIESIDDNTDVKIGDIVSFEDNELLNALLEVILEENGLAEITEDEAKNDQDSLKQQQQS